MKLYVAKEPGRQETRAALLPGDAGKLVQLGAEVEVAAGIGRGINVSDGEYEKAGVHVSTDHKASLGADMVLRMGVPDPDEIPHLGEGAIHVSMLDPFNNAGVVRAMAAQKVSAISLEMVPRTTIAQKMDVLSSQANLAGYVAVILAASRQNKILPMMMTPAGTIAPARVFVIGAGVAGLQAIATAKRLGARVDAFDVRPEAQEQILSLGAKPLKIDLGQTGQTKDGYAKRLTDEQLAKQREAMARQCAQSDIVITTAKVFGKKAPVIVTAEMIEAMKPGSVIVDMAVETGGNGEGSKPDKEVQHHGVTIIGRVELPRRVPVAASQMFSSNLYNFVEHFWHKDTKRFLLDREDAIIQGCLITHAGEIVHPAIQEAIA